MGAIEVHAMPGIGADDAAMDHKEESLMKRLRLSAVER
jgi:hypothetical protein